MRVLATFLIFLLSAFASDVNQQPKIIFWNMQRQSVDMLVHNVPQRDADRLAQLKQTFRDLECKGDNLRELPGRRRCQPYLHAAWHPASRLETRNDCPHRTL